MRQILISLAIFLSVLSFGQTQQYVTSAKINMRTSPEITNNVIYTIPTGTAIYALIIPTNEDWAITIYNGQLGYVHQNYLNPANHESKNSLQTTDKKVTGTSARYYTNSAGFRVQSPTYYPSRPAGATAICRDGTYSFSHSRRGTCSGHGGVSQWLR